MRTERGKRSGSEKESIQREASRYSYDSEIDKHTRKVQTKAHPVSPQTAEKIVGFLFVATQKLLCFFTPTPDGQWSH